MEQLPLRMPKIYGIMLKGNPNVIFSGCNSDRVLKATWVHNWSGRLGSAHPTSFLSLSLEIETCDHWQLLTVTSHDIESALETTTLESYEYLSMPMQYLSPKQKKTTFEARTVLILIQSPHSLFPFNSLSSIHYDCHKIGSQNRNLSRPSMDSHSNFFTPNFRISTNDIQT